MQKASLKQGSLISIIKNKQYVNNYFIKHVNPRSSVHQNTNLPWWSYQLFNLSTNLALKFLINE